MKHRFLRDVLSNRHNAAIFERWTAIQLPDCWLVAGCLFQSVWNLRNGREPEAHIKDYDLFYFDGNDLSEASEIAVQLRLEKVFEGLGFEIEASNQARVHLWYESYFGEAYEALSCTSDGIDRFLIKESCVGVRPGEVYAPNGIEAVYAGQLTPNPRTPHRHLFDEKAASYRRRWPWLRIADSSDH